MFQWEHRKPSVCVWHLSPDIAPDQLYLTGNPYVLYLSMTSSDEASVFFPENSRSNPVLPHKSHGTHRFRAFFPAPAEAAEQPLPDPVPLLQSDRSESSSSLMQIVILHHEVYKTVALHRSCPVQGIICVSCFPIPQRQRSR